MIAPKHPYGRGEDLQNFISLLATACAAVNESPVPKPETF